jgi:hypothetical protein
MLDQQVKLINGNEANLLVPQEWMKKYLKNQEQGLQQLESSPQPCTSRPLVQSMDIFFSC